MLLKTSSGVDLASPSPGQIADALRQLTDPGDFIVLADLERGELRFAGPLEGTFLGQCDIPLQTHLFSGELNAVPAEKAIAILTAFSNGDTSWLPSFHELTHTSRASKVIALLSGIVGLAIAYYWLILR